MPCYSPVKPPMVPLSLIGGGSANVYVNLAPVVNVGQNPACTISTKPFAITIIRSSLQTYVTLQPGSAYGGASSIFCNVRIVAVAIHFRPPAKCCGLFYNSRTDKPWPVALY
ncbi:fimbrial protein [Shigella flexneri]